MHQTISDCVKDLRKKRYWTQAQLAQKAGVGLRFIRDLEQGKDTLCLKKLNDVMAVFQFEMYPVSVRTKRPYVKSASTLKWRDISDPEITTAERRRHLREWSGQKS